jgi:hypothetical protein
VAPVSLSTRFDALAADGAPPTDALDEHFKVVDHNTVMGIMSGKLEPVFGTADPYYFWLERSA